MEGYFITVNVIVDDVDDLGQVAINIISDQYETLAANFRMNKSELINENLLNGNQITKQFFVFEPGEYQIETLVRNKAGANLPKIVTAHNI